MIWIRDDVDIDWPTDDDVFPAFLGSSSSSSRSGLFRLLPNRPPSLNTLPLLSRCTRPRFSSVLLETSQKSIARDLPPQSYTLPRRFSPIVSTPSAP